MSAPDFAVRLRATRARTGLSRKYVAEQLKCDVTTLSRWERGAFEPNIATIAKLAVLYGVSVDYLVTGERERENGNAA
jgi:transcriptional regulator with XRE-family HTH domain